MANCRGAVRRGGFVRELNTLVGRLLDEVKALRIEDNTLILFNSDRKEWKDERIAMLKEAPGGD